MHSHARGGGTGCTSPVLAANGLLLQGYGPNAAGMVMPLVDCGWPAIGEDASLGVFGDDFSKPSQSISGWAMC